MYYTRATVRLRRIGRRPKTVRNAVAAAAAAVVVVVVVVVVAGAAVRTAVSSARARAAGP